MTDPQTAVAAVDCGTNSTRLLVMGHGGERLERVSRITRLGAGVDRSGHLDPAAVERTVAVLSDYRRRLDHHGLEPGRVRAAATSATRDADNADDFLERAEEVLGVRPEVIEGTEEGRLSYRGATADLDAADGPFLVVDIGGGSTELIVGSAEATAGIAAVVSLDIGCVRLSERFFEGDPPTDEELESAKKAAYSALAKARDDEPAFARGRRLIGLAGTVSSLTVMILGLETFESERVHLARVRCDAVAEMTRELAAMPLEERRRQRGIEPERADVIVGGAAVLEAVMDVFGYEEFTASESDILDGMALQLREDS